MTTTINENALPRDGSEYLTLDQAARFLGLHHDHDSPAEAMRYLCRTRQVKFAKVSGRYRFHPDWLRQYVQAQVVEPVRRVRSRR